MERGGRAVSADRKIIRHTTQTCNARRAIACRGTAVHVEEQRHTKSAATVSLSAQRRGPQGCPHYAVSQRLLLVPVSFSILTSHTTMLTAPTTGTGQNDTTLSNDAGFTDGRHPPLLVQCGLKKSLVETANNAAHH